MAKGKYQRWLQEDGIAQIENWAAKGLTYAEIAHNMGITESTFYVWLDKFSDISEALKRGRARSITAIENMAFKVAMGEVTEQVATKVKNTDGSERMEIREKKLPPNVAMLIFMLKNRVGYSDNPNATDNEVAQAPTFVFDSSVYENVKAKSV